MSPFKAGLLVFFGVLALASVFIFATFSSGARQAVGDVVVWGTLSQEIVDDVLKSITSSSDGFEGVEYEEISEGGFSTLLTEAIAAGRGPDLVLLPGDAVVRDQEKIVPISYRTFSRREFQDSFVEAGEVFLAKEGVLGLPFYIDPFVMYWNRTLFSGAGIPRAPRFWDEFVDQAPLLSKATETGTLTQSAVALGEWENVTHAKEVLTSLIVGLGNDIVVVNEDGELQPVLNDRGSSGATPAESALRFYTDFADPAKSVYSWNRAQADSRSAFLAGILAVYFGRSGEVFDLRAANPNLNFDVAHYPRVRDGRVATPANVFALSIPRGSSNPQGAVQVALLLASENVQRELADQTGLPSVRRDVISIAPENPFQTIFRDAALNAFIFRDPDTVATDSIFERMVEDVSSGKQQVPGAIRGGQDALRALIGGTPR